MGGSRRKEAGEAEEDKEQEKDYDQCGAAMKMSVTMKTEDYDVDDGVYHEGNEICI